jgi:hypothetical protein
VLVTDERRTSPRHTAYLAGELESDEGRSSIAITRDVGAGGLLLFTRLRNCGEAVKLTVVHGGKKLQVTGKVVREERVEDSELWRTKLAISVDQSDPVIASLFAAIAAQQS